jgi:hypothetical protein
MPQKLNAYQYPAVSRPQGIMAMLEESRLAVPYYVGPSVLPEDHLNTII